VALKAFADRIVASDPALVRLYMGARATGSVGVALVVLLALQRELHFDLSAALVGVPFGMIANIAVADTVHREQKISTLFVCLPFAASIVVATFARPDRFLSDVLFVVVLFLGIYLRTYGPRGAASGALSVVGFFFALAFRILPAELPWALFAIALTGLCTYAFRFVVFRDEPRLALRNAAAAFRARERLIAGAIAAARRRGRWNRPLRNALEHHLSRLNEAALALHDILSAPKDRLDVLEVELAVAEAADDAKAAPSRVVTIESLHLRDDAQVAAEWTPRGPFRLGTQIDTGRIPPTLRQAIQISAAGILAIALGEIISADRWYWAVITAFFVFIGTSSAGETRARAWSRVTGTAFGVTAGVLLSYLVRGHEHLALAVLMLSLFVAVYANRWSFAFFTGFITIVIAMLYVALGIFYNQLLELRLVETALGAVLGGTAAALLLPISSKTVLLNVTVEALKRLNDVVKSAVDLLNGDGQADPIDAARKFDEALQSARIQIQPLLSPSRAAAGRVYRMRLILMTACAYYARALASLAYECPDGCSPSVLFREREAISADIQAIIAFNEGTAPLGLPRDARTWNVECGKAGEYLLGIDRAVHGLARTLGA
jgi:hypothetical protein